MLRRFQVVVLGVLLLSAPAAAGEYSDSLKMGKVDLQSAGALAFGPEGILFVGDSRAAAIVALATGENGTAKASPINVKSVDEKVAALLGTTPDRIRINDLAVSPYSGKAYMSVSRGRGPDAIPVILRMDSSGSIEELGLDNIGHARVGLPNPPDARTTDRRGRSSRQEAITDLAFADGQVIVAGLSNEEFASTLRAIPFPFTESNRGTAVEIFHGSHGRLETNSPVRTFVPFEIEQQPHILAAYTCTPLVTFPMDQLKPGAKIVGKTIAELGNRNRPLDMIVYSRGGEDYVLMSNSSRGVMKMKTSGVAKLANITERTDVAGLPYETIESMQGVEQLDKLGDEHALILARDSSGSLDLSTVTLP